MGSLITKVSRGNFRIDLNKKMLNSIVYEELHHYLTEELIKEYKWSPKQMKDSYGDVLCAIIENLACVCLYPDERTVPHWKNRAIGFCKKLAEINIKPNNKNTPSERFKILSEAVEEILDNDYGALPNHFKSVATFYASKEDPHEKLFPYIPWNECYRENQKRVIDAIEKFTRLIANKDTDNIKDFITNF